MNKPEIKPEGADDFPALRAMLRHKLESPGDSSAQTVQESSNTQPADGAERAEVEPSQSESDDQKSQPSKKLPAWRRLFRKIDAQ